MLDWGYAWWWYSSASSPPATINAAAFSTPQLDGRTVVQMIGY